MNGNAMSRFTTPNGIVFSRRGAGRPVVLVHGWCLNRTMWGYAEEFLAHDFEVLTADLAGFGRSDGLAGPYSLERHAADLAAVLDAADVGNALLVGFAYGAMVSLELVRHAAGRVGGVVAVGLPDRSSSPYEKMPKAMRRDWPDFARRSANALFHNPQSEATLAWLELMFRSAPLPVALETVATLAQYDPVAAAGAATTPVVFVHGENDPVAPVSVGKACAEAARQGRLEVIPQCGHLIVLDQKAPFHALVAGVAATPSLSAGSTA